ncbi:DUF2934 domain-containing protein [Mesorhizobium retamae]|uniref:DUF2934 domain-containing protein n=1 Tax=Mesorhizobium retamae TaxID=2912854 RepID=A0ABS9QCE3_9HYPH|nr:DUF2934 domain-containing protein [Mesorhizobium sp. IRAMC:0171]MCG7505098.1 DUF2934 domain-containing protein [Mesorhizobium sp. IRAMC:0171]
MSDRIIQTASAPQPQAASSAEGSQLTAPSTDAGESGGEPGGTDLVKPGATDTRNERIRARAQKLWQEGGQLDGNQEDHWIQAEQDIDEEDRLAAETSTADNGTVASAETPDESSENAESVDELSIAEQRRPLEEFPPFDDPAFSPEPAQPPLGLSGSAEDSPNAGHSEFVQDADAAAAPAPQQEGVASGFQDGASAPAHRTPSGPATEKTAGAGSAIAERSKDAKEPGANPQPGTYVRR